MASIDNVHDIINQRIVWATLDRSDDESQSFETISLDDDNQPDVFSERQENGILLHSTGPFTSVFGNPAGPAASTAPSTADEVTTTLSVSTAVTAHGATSVASTFGTLTPSDSPGSNISSSARMSGGSAESVLGSNRSGTETVATSGATFQSPATFTTATSTNSTISPMSTTISHGGPTSTSPETIHARSISPSTLRVVIAVPVVLVLILGGLFLYLLLRRRKSERSQGANGNCADGTASLPAVKRRWKLKFGGGSNVTGADTELRPQSAARPTGVKGKNAMIVIETNVINGRGTDESAGRAFGTGLMAKVVPARAQRAPVRTVSIISTRSPRTSSGDAQQARESGSPVEGPPSYVGGSALAGADAIEDPAADDFETRVSENHGQSVPRMTIDDATPRASVMESSSNTLAWQRSGAGCPPMSRIDQTQDNTGDAPSTSSPNVIQEQRDIDEIAPHEHLAFDTTTASRPGTSSKYYPEALLGVRAATFRPGSADGQSARSFNPSLYSAGSDNASVHSAKAQCVSPVEISSGRASISYSTSFRSRSGVGSSYNGESRPVTRGADASLIYSDPFRDDRRFASSFVSRSGSNADVSIRRSSSKHHAQAEDDDDDPNDHTLRMS